jgi:hypothetical protein
MHPGTDCIGCHGAEDEGPQFSVAGTVMGDLADPDDCHGIEGVVVQVTDAEGLVHEMVTNAPGNFLCPGPSRWCSSSMGRAAPWPPGRVLVPE